MNKNTIPLIIIAIAVICFGLAGLGLVIFNIKNDVKPKYDEQGHEVEMMHHYEPDVSHKEEH